MKFLPPNKKHLYSPRTSLAHQGASMVLGTNINNIPKKLLFLINKLNGNVLKNSFCTRAGQLYSSFLFIFHPYINRSTSRENWFSMWNKRFFLMKYRASWNMRRKRINTKRGETKSPPIDQTLGGVSNIFVSDPNCFFHLIFMQIWNYSF